MAGLGDNLRNYLHKPGPAAAKRAAAREEAENGVGDAYARLKGAAKMKPKTPGERAYADEKSAASAASYANKATLIGTRG